MPNPDNPNAPSTNLILIEPRSSTLISYHRPQLESIGFLASANNIPVVAPSSLVLKAIAKAGLPILEPIAQRWVIFSTDPVICPEYRYLHNRLNCTEVQLKYLDLAVLDSLGNTCTYLVRDSDYTATRKKLAADKKAAREARLAKNAAKDKERLIAREVKALVASTVAAVVAGAKEDKATLAKAQAASRKLVDPSKAKIATALVELDRHLQIVAYVHLLEGQLKAKDVQIKELFAILRQGTPNLD